MGGTTPHRVRRYSALAIRAHAPIESASVGRLRIGDRDDRFSRLIHDKLLEAVRHVRLRDVDVIPLSHARRAVSHEPSQRESIHPALSTASAERMPPAIERERRESRLLHRTLVWVLDRDQVAFVSRSWEHVLVLRLAVLRLRSAQRNEVPYFARHSRSDVDSTRVLLLLKRACRKQSVACRIRILENRKAPRRNAGLNISFASARGTRCALPLGAQTFQIGLSE
jgi:hypothetical protein